MGHLYTSHIMGWAYRVYGVIILIWICVCCGFLFLVVEFTFLSILHSLDFVLHFFPSDSPSSKYWEVA